MTPRRFHRIRQILDHKQPDLTLFVDNVQNEHNVSALVRTADAVGLMEIHAVSPKDNFKPSHQSAGGVRKWVKVRTHPTHAAAAEHLKQNFGCQILAAHFTDDAIDYRDADYTRPTAILLGAEREGVSQEAQEVADGAIIIPMMGAGQSLNVSVAGAVILYEAQRQRDAAGMYEKSRLEREHYEKLLFEWCYPSLVKLYKKRAAPYPALDEDGAIVD